MKKIGEFTHCVPAFKKIPVSVIIERLEKNMDAKLRLVKEDITKDHFTAHGERQFSEYPAKLYTFEVWKA